MIDIRKTSAYIATLLWLVSMASPSEADGPGPATRPTKRPDAAPSALLQQRAIDAYNIGYAAIQRADHAQALADASSDPTEKKQSLDRSRQAYEESLPQFERAVKFDASMHEAYTYLGYANRKLGRHAKALAAYSHALQIEPDYPYAIEYQGEAYLGLNRIDEARFNYLRLYALNKGQARKLLRAMQTWVVDAHPSDAAHVASVGEFAEWVARRAEMTQDDATSINW